MPQDNTTAVEGYYDEEGEFVDTVEADAVSQPAGPSQWENQVTPDWEDQVTPSDEQQAPPVAEQRPAAPVQQARQQQAEPAVQQRPAPAVQQQAEPAVQQRPAPAVQQQAEPAVQQRPAPAVQQQAAPSYDDDEEGSYNAAGEWVVNSSPTEQGSEETQSEDPRRPGYRADKRTPTIPTSGWRHLIYTITDGRVNPGISKAQAHFQELQATIDTPIDVHRITVGCAKGGVGKSTVTVALGTVFARMRRDQSVAIDANPDLGTLAERVGANKSTTVRDLLESVDDIGTANDLRRFLSQADSRLEVLAAEEDPTQRRAFSPEEYTLVQQVLGTFRQCILTDTGTDLTHPVLAAIMQHTDSLVIASDPTATGTKKTIQTLRAWEQRCDRGEELVSNAVVSVRLPQAKMSKQAVDAQVDQYRGRVRKVIYIPNDSFLAKEEDPVFEWSALSSSTRDAYMELAAAVAESFPGAHLMG